MSVNGNAILLQPSHVRVFSAGSTGLLVREVVVTSFTVWTIVALWLALTAMTQVEGAVTDWIRSVDVWKLIPRWTFFAPQPGRSDIHLVYRDWSARGEAGPWKEIYPIVERPLRTALWNPDKRRRKAIVDLSVALLRTAHQTASADAALTVPYLAFLNVVSNIPTRPDTHSRQFALVSTDGPRFGSRPRVLACSQRHPLQSRLTRAA